MNCWDTAKQPHHNVAGNGERDGLKTGLYVEISRQAAWQQVEASTTRAYNLFRNRYNVPKSDGEQMMKPQECAATKICNVCEVEKPISEFYVRKGHVQKYCLACKRERSRSHYRANKQSYKNRAVQWANDNRERRREIVRDHDARNRENIRAYHEGRKEEVNAVRRQAYAESPEAGRQASNDWYHANKHRLDVRAARVEACAVRRRKLDQATPCWANKAAMLAVYEQAQLLNDETGIEHHVDHIYPINSDEVCGLHCEDNLQILTATENVRKSNNLVEDIVSSTGKPVGAEIKKSA